MSTDQPLNLMGCTDAELLAASNLSLGCNAARAAECSDAVMAELRRLSAARSAKTAAVVCCICGKGTVPGGLMVEIVGGFAHDRCTQQPSAIFRGEGQ